MSSSPKENSNRPRGIYLLPNLFTLAGLFCGFYAVISSASSLFEYSAIAIFVAMLMDALDGRVARLTKTQTSFGAEFDSLADIVSFGVAPAMVAYNWALSDLGRFGWLAAFVFVAGGALRLARFNTQIGNQDKRYFQGLPIPSAAAVIAGTVWVASDLQLDIKPYGVVVGIVTMVLGLLMVSNFRYHSFKEINWKEKIPFTTLLLILIVFVVLASKLAWALCIIFTVYASSGPVMTLWHRQKFRHRREAKNTKSVDDGL